MRLRTRVRALVGAGLAAAVVAAVAPAEPAGAQALPVDLTGSATSHIAALINADVEFRASFSGQANLATGEITGDIQSEPGTLTFNALGILPATNTLDVRFEPLTGTVDVATLAVTVQATFDVEITSFKLFGFEGLDPAHDCVTTTPITTTLTGTLDPTTGITLSGTYAIPAFAGCGAWEPWINLFASGPGNTIEATLAPPA